MTALADRQILAVQHAAILRALTEPTEPPTLTELAQRFGKDVSNFRKVLVSLEGVGLITMPPILLTDAGLDIVPRLDVLAGAPFVDSPLTEMMPPGMIARRHRDIFPDPHNPRETSGVSDEEILIMADSMVEKGILQKLSVRETITDPESDNYGMSQLQDGYRRWLAWGLNIERGAWGEDRVEICSIFVGDDLQASEGALIANDQRSNLHNLERGETYLRLSKTYRRSAAEISRSTGRQERFVQIAMQVAERATAEDKQRFIDSQNAKARGEKATFTWEDLRESVRTPKHVTELAKSPRMALMVSELALRAQIDHACGALITSTSYMLIQAPPGGGIYTTALDLKLIESEYVEAGVFARCADLGWKWLEDEGFQDDPAAFVQKLRVEALGDMGATLAAARGYGTPWVNAPKPPPPVVAPTPPQDPEPAADTPEPASAAPQTFSEQMRALAREERAAAGEAPPISDAAAAGIEQPLATQQRPAEPQAPDLSPGARLALIELSFKIGDAPVLARGGAIVGAEIGNNYHLDKASQELTTRRLVAFMPMPGGKGWLAYLTPGGSQWIADNGFGAAVDVYQVVTAREDAGQADPETYATPWLAPPAPTPRVRPVNPDEATDETITPWQALLLGEVLFKTHHTPWRHPDGSLAAELAMGTPDVFADLKPLLYGGYLAHGRTVNGSQYLRATEAAADYLTARDLHPLKNRYGLAPLRTAANLEPDRLELFAIGFLNTDRPQHTEIAPTPISQADQLAAAMGVTLTPIAEPGPHWDDEPDAGETPPMPWHLVYEFSGVAHCVGVWTEDDGRQVGAALAESGHFESLTLRDRTGTVMVEWGEG